MRLSFIILIFISLSRIVSAQTASENKYRAIVKWTPSSLFTPATPTMQFGIEIMSPSVAKHKFGVEFDFGFPCVIAPAFTKNYTVELYSYNAHSSQYTKSRVELRKYFKVRETRMFYLAVEGFYIPYSFVDISGTYTSIDNSQYVFDSAHVTKDIQGGALKFGFVLKFKSPWSIEGFAGLGLRHVKTTVSNVINKQPPNSYHQISDFAEGETNSPHLAAGIKVGYRIF